MKYSELVEFLNNVNRLQYSLYCLTDTYEKWHDNVKLNAQLAYLKQEFSKLYHSAVCMDILEED